jgi:hypothetical protein
MSARVIIVNAPGPVGPRGPGGIYDGTGSLVISGSVAATSSFWNIVTPEFQVVTDPAYINNHFFLVKNEYNELKIGTLSVEAGMTLTTQVDSAIVVNNTSKDVFILTSEGIAYFTSQSSLPDFPLQGGLLFSGSDFFVST